MSSVSNFLLFGEFFVREFSFIKDHDQLNNSLRLFRINKNFHAWYTEKYRDSYPDYNIGHITDQKEKIIRENLGLIRNVFNEPVEVYELGFSKITKHSDSTTHLQELRLEPDLLGKRKYAKFQKMSISKGLLLDSMFYHPVLPEDTFSQEINRLIFETVYPDFSTDSNIIILTGELIWSGWLTLDILLDRLNKGKLKNKLIFVDSWGVIEQFLADKNFRSLLKNINLNTILNSFSLSMFISDRSNKSVQSTCRAENKLSEEGLYSNTDLVKSYPDDFSHKPDYIFIKEKKRKKQKKELKIIPLGILNVSSLLRPESILGKSNMQLELQSDVLIQRSEGDNIKIGDDIGLYPKVQSYIYKIKLPKQFKLTASDGQLVKKGDVIGLRTVLKNLLSENVLSPYEGFINTKYIDFGILKFNFTQDKEKFISPFEGTINSIEKPKNRYILKVSTYSYTLVSVYKNGPDAVGKLVTLDELTEVQGDKILLLSSLEGKNIDKETIILNNIVGILLVSVNYEALKRLTNNVLDGTRLINISVLNPFSLEYKNDLAEILFLYTRNLIIIEGNKISLLLSREQMKEIFIRLKSKKIYSENSVLKKGDQVLFFDYSQQDRCARIEKVFSKGIVLSTRGELVNAKLNNISKLSLTEFNGESRKN